MARAAGVSGLWEVAADQCGLAEGEICHYWFEAGGARVTDPLAFTVDWRLAPGDRPAAVIRFRGGQLEPCDPGGDTPQITDAALDTLPPNNHLVIYELPTAWARNSGERGVGTFQDVLALIEPEAGGANFSDLEALQPGRSYLQDLGVNAIELLPPADSAYLREWGYGTTNFFAPDHELGFPEGHSWPTANRDLAALVTACHRHGIRFFVDVVMAFARQGPYETLDFDSFHIADPGQHRDDPDALTSGRGGGGQEVRNGFGSTLFRYAKPASTYDPLSGRDATLFPARQYMLACLDRWSRDFHIDGIRMDSVENVANWDFIRDYKDHARELFRQRWNAQGLGDGADSRFLVVGEELTMPMELLRQGRLDGLWNDRFREFIRPALLGRNAESEPSFEWTVRKAIDCRNVGFRDGAQAINYLTSHDVEGFRRERLFHFLRGTTEVEKRVKLGFACLLTAVGIPMILAGDEFADDHDRCDCQGQVTQQGGKQVDPVNYGRLGDPMRQRVLQHVSRLVKLRTAHPALGFNDTDFIHVDFNGGKRVLVWQRGQVGNPVVVVANFSDFSSSAAEYVVPTWPSTPAGRTWREVTQNRAVPAEWIGREPVFSWEAKVYVLA
jgi:1,4-alpha-glucan branching enzyme